MSPTPFDPQKPPPPPPPPPEEILRERSRFSAEPFGYQAYGTPQEGKGSAVLGFFLLVVCHGIWVLEPFMFLLLGGAQLLYGVPLLIAFSVRREFRTVAGVGVAMAVTLLANGIFCGVLLNNLKF